MQEVMGYFAGLIAERRTHPQGESDILSTAMTWEVDGAKVTDGDLLAFCLLMFMAGLDTVAMQLSFSMYHLALNPGDRQRLVAEPGLWPSAIEEFLRYYAFVSPGRKVMRDTEVGGCPVKAGSMVWLPLASANRDPEEFPDADKVIIDRRENRHAAFGLGIHRCIGSNLARLTFKTMVGQFLRRMPDYEIDPAGIVRYDDIGTINGYRSLPARFTPVPREGAPFPEVLARWQERLDAGAMADAGAG
jgi:cytochrome P450